jgi:hypothetical protein
MKEYLSNKNLVIFVLLAAVVVLILTNFKSCSGAAYDKQQALQNEQAMKKVITTEKNKNGELQHSIIAYEGKVKDLSKYSKELSEDVKALKNRKPEVIIKTKLVYVGDTSKKVKNTLKENGNGNYDLEWKFTNNSRILEGKSSFNAKLEITGDSLYKINVVPGTTQLTKDELAIDIVVGVAKNEKTGYDEIFVTPKDTNIKVRNLEGAILNKTKPSYWNISAQLGYGLTYGNGNIATGPYLGVGISYNIGAQIKDLFKKKRKVIP